MLLPVGHILDARLEYKELYFLSIDKDISIFFKPLSLDKYEALRKFSSMYPRFAEDFKDKFFMQHIIQYVDTGAGVIYIEGMEDAPEIYTMKDLLDVIPAGVVETFYKALIAISAPLEPQEFESQLNLYRNINYYDIIQTILSLTASVYHLDVDTLKQKTWEEIIKLFVSAESILTGEIPKLPLSLVKEENGKQT